MGKTRRSLFTGVTQTDAFREGSEVPRPPRLPSPRHMHRPCAAKGALKGVPCTAGAVGACVASLPL